MRYPIEICACVRSALRVFPTWEQVCEAAPSQSFRDLLQRMEKLGFISETSVWLTLRDVRNRIAHEYLPDELAKIYASLVGPAAIELRRLRDCAGDVALATEAGQPRHSYSKFGRGLPPFSVGKVDVVSAAGSKNNSNSNRLCDVAAENVNFALPKELLEK